MPTGEEQARPLTLAEYLAVLRRRKWIILQTLVLVPAAAVLLSLQQERLYRASAEVLLSRQSLAAALTGTPDPTMAQDPERFAHTQAALARAPQLAERVIRASGVEGVTGGDLLANSTVTAKPNADLLVFEVTERDPDLAARLATAYAREFTVFRSELDTQNLKQARTEL